MTPQEKVEDLLDAMDKPSDRHQPNNMTKYQQVKCAIAAVDEVITALENNVWQNQKYIDYYKEVRYILEEM